MRRNTVCTAVALAMASLLSACGGRGGLGDRERGGELLNQPATPLAVVTGEQLAQTLSATDSGRALLQLASKPRCGIRFHKIEYRTVGAKGEATNATGALMLPQGDDPACQGARPTLLYAHGTAADRSFDISNPLNKANPGAGEGMILAAFFAAQGYRVVAPNYAGYDQSRLGYHPYLHADQSARDMRDALRAARTAMNQLGEAAGGALLLSGYSQGGHVAMATQRALQQAGEKVAAAAPLSGPYALAAFGDAIFSGRVNAGATVFTPLVVESYQRAYGNLYQAPAQLFAGRYADSVPGLLPSATPVATLVQQGRLPASALFSTEAPAQQYQALTPPTTPPELAPLFARGFGSDHLITNAVRRAFLDDLAQNPAAPQNPLRQALARNDLRNWKPSSPMLLCGGAGDPTVFYGANTTAMLDYWKDLGSGLVTALDLEAAATGANDAFAVEKAGFRAAKAQAQQSGGAAGVTAAYHGGLVPPFCVSAARRFFAAHL
ncbi:alpha/beta fold hydrolase [Comamonas humi]